MTIKPWKVLETTYLRKKVRIDKCELPNGQTLEPLILEYGSWVTVFALTKDQEVVLIRQYRHGVQQVLWEFPGGVVDDGEETLEAAKRELLEETGYISDRFIEIGKIFPNSVSFTNSAYFFLALDVEKVSDQNLDETEEIEVFLKSLDETIDMAKHGELEQAIHITALFYALAYLGRIV
ncbi:MAG: NUDIX hydrolase [Anaerolineales bacterium]|nr:NUDIX hydrolase [Anaerolineales bacterium]